MLTFLVIVNTCLTPVMVGYLNFDFFGAKGMIYDIRSTFMVAVVVVPLMSFFKFSWVIKEIKKCIFKKKYNKDPSTVNYTQRETNELFERDQWNISKKFAEANKNILVPLFF